MTREPQEESQPIEEAPLVTRPIDTARALARQLHNLTVVIDDQTAVRFVVIEDHIERVPLEAERQALTTRLARSEEQQMQEVAQLEQALVAARAPREMLERRKAELDAVVEATWQLSRR